MLSRQQIHDQLFAQKTKEALIQRYVYGSLAAAVVGGTIAAKLFDYSNYGYSTHGSTLIKRGNAKIAVSLASAIASAAAVTMTSYYYNFPTPAMMSIVVWEEEIDHFKDVKANGRSNSETNLLKTQALIRNGLCLLAWTPFIGYVAARIFHQRSLRTELAATGLHGTERTIEATYQRLAHRNSVIFGASVVVTRAMIFGSELCLKILRHEI